MKFTLALLSRIALFFAVARKGTPCAVASSSIGDDVVSFEVSFGDSFGVERLILIGGSELNQDNSWLAICLFVLSVRRD